MKNSKNMFLFFSYGHDEYSSIVIKIKKYLEELGYNIFFDNEQLKTGKDWEYKLENGIKTSDKIIFFITPHSARKPDGYCLNELALALFYQKDILPIMLKFEIPPLSIIRQQYLDLQQLTKGDFNLDVLKKQIDPLIDVIENRVTLDFEGTQAKILKDLNPIDFKQDFSKHKKIIGREWIKEEINQWINNKHSSSLFWIVAEAGYGKSAIASYLANEHEDVIGIHFCNYNYPNKKDPINVIKTLAFHFQRQLPDYLSNIKYIDIENKSLYELFEELILNPFYQLQDKNKIYIFIIDALGEAETNGENKLAELIRDEFSKLPSNIKIIITSRPNAKLKQMLSQYKPIILNVKSKRNKEDCEEVIKYFLEQEKDKKYNKDFIKTLLYKSNFNMLYLNKFFEDVYSGNINLSEPESFPSSLNGLYDNFLNRIIQDKKLYKNNYLPIFEVMLAYENPIDINLLAEIVNMDIQLLKKSLYRFTTILKEKDNTIDFYHESLRVWLLMHENVSYQINIKNARKRLLTFIVNLSKKSYKREYLKLLDLNIWFTNYLFHEEKSLLRFYSILENFKNDKKKIELLINLNNYFLEFQQLDIANNIEIYTFKLLEKLYQENKYLWVNEFTTILNNKGSFYARTNQVAKAIPLQIKNLQIRKCEYQKESELGLRNYSVTLNNLAVSYYKIEQYQKSLNLHLENYKRIYLLKSKEWKKSYIITLGNLANNYSKLNKFKGAIKIQKRCLIFCQQLYLENKNYWLQDYINALTNLATIYAYKKEYHLAINYQKESIEILDKYYNEESKYLNKIYLISLTNLGNFYSKNFEFKKSNTYYQKALLVCEKDTHIYHRVKEELNILEWRLLNKVEIETQNNNINIFDSIKSFFNKNKI